MTSEQLELLKAAECALGFVYGERVECWYEQNDRPPIVPQEVRSIAAEQVFNRLERAVTAVKQQRNGDRLEPMIE